MTIHTPFPGPDAGQAGHPADRTDPRDDAPTPTPLLLPDPALVPVAARHDGWTPERQRGFIEALADGGNVAAAARCVGMTAESAYRLRRRADAGGFDRAWTLALGHVMDRLLPAALDRAVNGTLRTRWYRGEVVAEERVHHDALLLHLLDKGQAMLKASTDRWHRGVEWDGVLDALGRGGAVPDYPPEARIHYRLWYSRMGGWMTNCPPPPSGHVGFQQGSTQDATYQRTLTAEEEAARRRLVAAGQDGEEVMRRRLFALGPPSPDEMLANGPLDDPATADGPPSTTRGAAKRAPRRARRKRPTP